jgi:hypothetical protein
LPMGVRAADTMNTLPFGPVEPFPFDVTRQVYGRLTCAPCRR